MKMMKVGDITYSGSGKWRKYRQVQGIFDSKEEAMKLAKELRESDYERVECTKLFPGNRWIVESKPQ